MPRTPPLVGTLLFAALALLPPAIGAPALDSAGLLARLSQGHPRLLLKSAEWEALRDRIQSGDRSVLPLWNVVLRGADETLTAPPATRIMTGRRLLSVSRQALTRLSCLAFAWRITDDRRYLDRAVAEVDAVCAFTDWNPSHFLDVGEMAAAVGLAFDAFHDAIPESVRARWADALERHAFLPGDNPGDWWVTAGNNWNQVCHGGLVVAALAVAERAPERAAGIIARALEHAPRALALYEPDGTYPEGPGYWSYGTHYSLVMIDALRTALGTDFGLVEAHPGLLRSAHYRLHVVTPAGRFYNYADNGSGADASPALLWFEDPAAQSLAWQQLATLEMRPGTWTRSEMRFLPAALAWRHRATAGKPPPAAPEPLPLEWIGHGDTPIAVFRSAWGNPDALFAGIKGGRASVSHGHIDVGSFIVEAGGVRWAEDPGRPDYNTMESSGYRIWDGRPGGERWTFTRFNQEGHSVPVFIGRVPDITAHAGLVDFVTSGSRRGVTVDLSRVYAEGAASYRRRLEVLGERQVAITDEFDGLRAGSVLRWSWVTTAEATPRGRTIVLSSGGRSFVVEVEAPAGATWEVEAIAGRVPEEGVPPTLKRAVLRWRADQHGDRGRIRVVGTCNED